MAESTPAPVTTAPDRWHTLTGFIRRIFDHERFAVMLPLLTIGITFAIVLVACAPVSTIDGERVTPGTIGAVYEGKAAAIQRDYAAWVATGEQIRIEAESLDNRYDAAFADFDAQVAQTNTWIEAIGGLGGSLIAGTFNPAALIGTAVTLGAAATAAGVGLDNRRKNRVITRLKGTPGVVA